MTQQLIPQRTIALSVVTCLPFSYGWGGPMRALDIAFDAELQGIQLVPILGYRAQDLNMIYTRDIVSYETDWRNPSKPRSLLKSALMLPVFSTPAASDLKAQMFRDLYPNSIGIDMRDGTGLLEVSPVNGTDEEIYYNHPHGVVFDTGHAREGINYTRGIDGFIDELYERQLIKLVHFQTRDKEELKNFLAGKPTELERLLKRVGKANTPVVIELDPRWTLPRLPKAMSKVLKEVGQHIRECLAA